MPSARPYAPSRQNSLSPDVVDRSKTSGGENCFQTEKIINYFLTKSPHSGKTNTFLKKSSFVGGGGGGGGIINNV